MSHDRREHTSTRFLPSATHLSSRNAKQMCSMRSMGHTSREKYGQKTMKLKCNEMHVPVIRGWDARIPSVHATSDDLL